MHCQELYDGEISAQTVNNTFSTLDKELERFRDKPIADTVEFLWLDGISQKVCALIKALFYGFLIPSFKDIRSLQL